MNYAYVNSKLLADLTFRLGSHRDALVLVGLLNNFADKAKFILKLRQFSAETLSGELSKSQVQEALLSLEKKSLVSISVYPKKYTEVSVDSVAVVATLTTPDETIAFDFPGSFEKHLAIYDLVYPEASKS